MGIMQDIRTLYHIALAPNGGGTHAERLERFYSSQADAYDGFRERLLQGRREMIESLPVKPGGVWVDMGGGTGHNVETLGERRLGELAKVYIVDLCPSLLGVARDRIRKHGWSNVEAVEGDATSFVPADGRADLVTFSYSLTMMPDWFRAVDHSVRLLRGGGHVGVVDFYVSRKHPAPGLTRHPWAARVFWQQWFAADNVFLNPDHLPYLESRFERLTLGEHRAKLPYMPLVRAPYYIFTGSLPPDGEQPPSPTR